MICIVSNSAVCEWGQKIMKQFATLLIESHETKQQLNSLFSLSLFKAKNKNQHVIFSCNFKQIDTRRWVMVLETPFIYNT